MFRRLRMVFLSLCCVCVLLVAGSALTRANAASSSKPVITRSCTFTGTKIDNSIERLRDGSVKTSYRIPVGGYIDVKAGAYLSSIRVQLLSSGSQKYSVYTKNGGKWELLKSVSGTQNQKLSMPNGVKVFRIKNTGKQELCISELTVYGGGKSAATANPKATAKPTAKPAATPKCSYKL